MMIIAGKSPIGVAAPPRFDIASNNENRLIMKKRSKVMASSSTKRIGRTTSTAVKLFRNAEIRKSNKLNSAMISQRCPRENLAKRIAIPCIIPVSRTRLVKRSIAK